MKHLGRLASKTATHKLGQILILLVLPILVLLAIRYFEARSDFALLAREKAGVELALHAIQFAETGTNQETVHRKWEGLIGLPAARGLATVNGSESSRRQKLQAYLADVGRASKLSLDALEKSHAAADTALHLIPAYATKVEGIVASLVAKAATAQLQSFDLAMLAISTHDIFSLSHEIEESVAAAGLSKAPDIPPVLERVRKLNTTLANFNPQANEVLQREWINQLRTQADAVVKTDIHFLQKRLLDDLSKQLDARRSGMWRSLLLLVLAGLASSLAGIGLAVLMVRSTLKRLDEVELARAEAIDARREAEHIAIRFSAINADISRLNQDLASNVNQLKEAQDELVKRGRMEQLGQVIATIAHEVRNPLGAIRTSAFMLERKLSDKNLGLDGHLQRINNSVNRCDTIISQLLDFSRTKSVNSSLVGLDEWLSKTVREEAARLPENVFIECALGLEGVQVAFDPARLQRAVINLLSNAAEALTGQVDKGTDKGVANPCIWVTTLQIGDCAAIRIADNGPGIPAEYINKIREPLFTTKSFGTGLGIPAVDQIVKQHGGRLSILSDVGKGAAFTIYLPLQRRSEEVA